MVVPVQSTVAQVRGKNTPEPYKPISSYSVGAVVQVFATNKGTSAQLLRRFCHLPQNSFYILYLYVLCFFPFVRLPVQPHHLSCLRITAAWHLCHHLCATSSLLTIVHTFLVCHPTLIKTCQVCVQSKDNIPPCFSHYNVQCARSRCCTSHHALRWLCI